LIATISAVAVGLIIFIPAIIERWG
jgi:hypothetical protein